VPLTTGSGDGCTTTLRLPPLVGLVIGIACANDAVERMPIMPTINVAVIVVVEW